MDTLEDIISHCQKNGITVTKITNKTKSLEVPINESIDPEKQIDEPATEGLKVSDDILEEVQSKDSPSNDSNEVISLDKVDKFFKKEVSADSCETYNTDTFESSLNPIIKENINVINNADNKLEHGEIKMGSQNSEHGINDRTDTQNETDEFATSTQFHKEIRKIKDTETIIDSVLKENENVNSKPSEDRETKPLNSENGTNDETDTQTQNGELATFTQFDKVLGKMITETKHDSVVEENKNINLKRKDKEQNSLCDGTKTQSQKDKIETGTKFCEKLRNVKNIGTQIGSVLEENENISSLQIDGTKVNLPKSESGDMDAQTQKIELAGTQFRKETNNRIEVNLDVGNNTIKTGLFPNLGSNVMKSGHVSDNMDIIDFGDDINIISISSESSENDINADNEEEAKTNDFFIKPRYAENSFVGMKNDFTRTQDDYKSVNGTKTKKTDLIPDLSSTMKSEHNISDNTVSIEFRDVTDIISISSESSESDISTDSELDSYSFELITEEEAKTNGFFTNPRKSENSFIDMKNDFACKQNDFNCMQNDIKDMQNDLNGYKSVNGTKTSSSVNDLYAPGPSRNDHLNRNNQMNVNNIRENHSIPLGEAYLDLFRGYNSLPLDEIHFLENKSTMTRTPMLTQFKGLGFDVRLAKNKRDNEEDAYAEEARENMKKIFSMYPEHNRKRKRRF